MKQSEWNNGLIENGNKYADELDFVCPLGKNKMNAMCSDCEIKAKKEWIEEKWAWIPIEPEVRTCEEYHKKIWTGACGCAGYYECICGFEEHFCNSFCRNNCPFCGRVVKTIKHKQPWMIQTGTLQFSDIFNDEITVSDNLKYKGLL